MLMRPHSQGSPSRESAKRQVEDEEGDIPFKRSLSGALRVREMPSDVSDDDFAQVICSVFEIQPWTHRLEMLDFDVCEHLSVSFGIDFFRDLEDPLIAPHVLSRVGLR